MRDLKLQSKIMSVVSVSVLSGALTQFPGAPPPYTHAPTALRLNTRRSLHCTKQHWQWVEKPEAARLRYLVQFQAANFYKCLVPPYDLTKSTGGTLRIYSIKNFQFTTKLLCRQTGKPEPAEMHISPPRREVPRPCHVEAVQSTVHSPCGGHPEP
jgi:hypothetical protein